MPTIEIDGFHLYYESQGKGTPLVFAHGVGGNHASWFNQVPVFSESYQTVVFDHRGFGNSRDVEGGPGRSRFVGDLEALLDHLEIEKTILVAQSMGGTTCTAFTVEHPERVSALVLADTVLGLELPEPIATEYERVRKAGDGLGQLERVLGPGTRNNEPVISSLYLEIASFNMVDRHTLSGRSASHTVDELAAAGVPIQFIVGTDDVLAPPHIVRAVHELVPGSYYKEVPGSGHSVYFEDPKAFNETIVTFLSAVLT